MPVETALLPIDKLIASIYSGISEPRPWQTFLYHLRERTDSELASLSLRRGRNGAVPIVILDRRYEISKEDALTMARDYAALIDQDPISSTRSTPGKVTSLRELVPPEERAQNAFYQKLMKPGGVEHYVGMWFGEPRGWRCLIRLMNRPDKPDYGESDRVLLRTLHPHLETALSLFAEIRRSRSELSEFHASLDRLLIGVMVLDSAGELVDANQAARSICSTNPLIHIRNSRMRFGSAQHNEEFNRILDSVLLSPSDHEGGPLVETLRMEAPGGQQLELLVRRVGQPDRYVGTQSPSVVVYISDREDRFNIHEKLLEKLFGLTKTEARLAALLANGLTLVDAGRVLGVTENTVRGYSKIIYSKLGINRQVDLVRVILKSVAMFG